MDCHTALVLHGPNRQFGKIRGYIRTIFRVKSYSIVIGSTIQFRAHSGLWLVKSVKVPRRTALFDLMNWRDSFKCKRNHVLGIVTIAFLTVLTYGYFTNLVIVHVMTRCIKTAEITGQSNFNNVTDQKSKVTFRKQTTDYADTFSLWLRVVSLRMAPCEQWIV